MSKLFCFFKRNSILLFHYHKSLEKNIFNRFISLEIQDHIGEEKLLKQMCKNLYYTLFIYFI